MTSMIDGWGARARAPISWKIHAGIRFLGDATRVTSARLGASVQARGGRVLGAWG